MITPTAHRYPLTLTDRSDFDARSSSGWVLKWKACD